MGKKIILIESQENLMPRRQLFLKTLKDNGYKVKCIMWDRSCNNPVFEIFDGICIERLRIKADYGDIYASLNIPKIYFMMLKKLWNEKFDILHCGHLFLLPLALFIKKIKRAKIVYDVAEFYVNDFFFRLPDHFRLFGNIAELFENILISFVDGVLTIGSYKEVLFNRYKKYNNNTEILYNVPELEGIKPSQYKIEKLKQQYGNKIIIYVGDIIKDRGVSKLLEATALIKKKTPDVKLLLIGKVIEDFQSEIMEKGISEHVIIIGFIPYKEIIDYLSVANVAVALYQPVKRFILSCKGNTRKIFDYMGASLPIVGSDFGEICTVIREENCGILVDATNPTKIAEAILYILNNPEKAKQMGERGYHAAKRKYNWENESRKILKVYNRI